MDLLRLAVDEYKRCGKGNKCKALEQLVGAVVDIAFAKMPDVLQDPNNRNETPVVFMVFS